MDTSKFSLRSLLYTIIIFSTSCAIASAEIHLLTNQATVLKLTQPAEHVIIGNPLIADASVDNANTLILTGKGFGVTNLIVLAADGTRIVDQPLIVSRQTAMSIRIYRQSKLQTLSCTPVCEGAYRNDAEKDSDTIISNQ